MLAVPGQPSAPVPARPVAVLVGPPGAGKTTIGRALGDRLGLPVRDTDADVEARAGTSVADIFVTDGEAAFRALEREAVADALVTHSGVLALGGGAVMDPLTEAALLDYREQGGCVVFLDVSLAAASPRVGLNQARPLLLGNPRAQWLALMETRRPVYTRVSSFVVSTDDREPAAICEEIAAALTRTPGAGDSAPTSTGDSAPTSTEDHA